MAELRGIDPPTGHMRYAGTISLPNVYFMKLVEYTAHSLRAHGFKELVAAERPQR